MATRAAIAAKDRENKKSIADADRRQQKQLKERELSLQETRAMYQNIGDAAKATKNLVQGASYVGGMMGNHPEWYKKYVNPALTSNLPTFERLGLAPRGFDLTNNVDYGTVSGIVSFHYVSLIPNVGKSGDSAANLVINTGLSRFMAELRKLNSRIGDYDPSDFGLYWYAAADYMTLIEKLRQAIKVYVTYYAENAYFTKAMLHAIGFMPDFIIANIAQIRALVEEHIKIFNSSIAIPKNLTFFARRLWMAQALIADRRSAKCQYYVFSPDSLGHLSADEDRVTFGASSSNKLRFNTMNALVTEFNTMKQTLVDSVGVTTMIADLRAGIPDSAMLKLDELDVNAIAVPTDAGYDLEQIHNLRTLPGTFKFQGNVINSTITSPGVVTNMDIRVTNDGYLIQGSTNVNTAVRPTYTPASIPTGAGFANVEEVVANDFLNIYHDDCTQDDVLEATRLRQLVTVNGDTGVSTIYSNGTEVVLYGLEYFYGWNGNLNVQTYNTFEYALTSILESVSVWSHYDWMPPIKFLDVSDESGEIYYTLCEFDNYFGLRANNLIVLHETCGLSEFYIDSKEFSRFSAR